MSNNIKIVYYCALLLNWNFASTLFQMIESNINHLRRWIR